MATGQGSGEKRKVLSDWFAASWAFQEELKGLLGGFYVSATAIGLAAELWQLTWDVLRLALSVDDREWTALHRLRVILEDMEKVETDGERRQQFLSTMDDASGEVGRVAVLVAGPTEKQDSPIDSGRRKPRKKNSSKEREIGKRRETLGRLWAEGCRNREALAAELNCSRRTVARDITALGLGD